MRIITKLFLTSCILAAAYFGYLDYANKRFIFRYTLPKQTYKTTSPTRRDIERKKVFVGNIIPHKEIKIESHITGLVEKLLVNVGDYVRQGTPIARIKIQPDAQAIETAESKLRLASIQLDQHRNKYLRHKRLFNKKMLSKEAYESSLADWEIAKENKSAAEKNLQITKYGYTKAKGADANVIKSTTKGTVLNLPAKEGSLVQQAKNQSTGNGTSVAVIGDMDHFLFSAKVSELDVIHLTKGMSFNVILNASKEDKFRVTLTRVSPKANEKDLNNGEARFEIEGMIHRPKDSKNILRAGYIAIAEIIIEKATNVLAVQEKMIQKKEKDYFVECLEAGVPVQKKVVLGLSDGMYVEVKKGLCEQDQLIVVV